MARTRDFARESDSLLALAWGLWRQCRGADFTRTADAALKLAKPLGPSPQLANASITLAYRHMIKNRYQDGLALLQHVREMSEQLGLGDVISDSLSVEARIVQAMGNDWTVLMQAALEIALSGGHEYRAGNAFANMYWMYCDELRHEEAEQITTRPWPTATYMTSAPRYLFTGERAGSLSLAAGTSACLRTPCLMTNRSPRQAGYSRSATRRK